jgi:hypothetical protein
MREDCIECTFEDLLDYEQPTKHIVKSTKYSDDYKTPVLTVYSGESVPPIPVESVPLCPGWIC